MNKILNDNLLFVIKISMKYINRFVQNDMYHKIENLVSKNSIEVKRKI